MKWHEQPAISLADYLLPDGLSDKEAALLLKCPITRICNIYKIKDPDGREVPFRPNRAQCIVLHAIYVAGWLRIAIPKARQLGFSTLFAIICLDETHFSTGKQASIVDQTQGDASEKLSKVKFAYERLPQKIRDLATKDNGRELEWANGSRVVGGMRARGGTNQVLHISEWGPIAYDDPKRSEEILTGAIPSVSGVTGKIFAESTHKGGKNGDWYELIKRALETPEEYRTAETFHVMFFPWWMEPRYTSTGHPAQLTKETHKYFDELEVILGVHFTDGQRLFYQLKANELGRNIYAEYPTTLEECWKAPTPGAIYAPEVDKARIAQRISDNVLHYEGFPVYTSFDIGAPANTWCWFWQVIGDRINYLEALKGGDECNTPAKWVQRIQSKKYIYGGHFLPHDGEVHWKAAMREAGLENVIAMTKPITEWDNINDAVAAFNRCSFNRTLCEEGITCLDAYHSKVETDGVTIRNVPVHDWCLAAGTQILTPEGWRSVQDISVHNEVLTPRGKRRVLRSGIVRNTNDWRNVKGIKCTPEHRFFTNRGLVQAGDLSSKDKLWTQGSWAPTLLASLCAVFRFGCKGAITLATQGRGESTGGRFCFTGLFTKLLTARFHSVTRSIISMMTNLITIPKTLLHCPSFSTGASTSQSRDLRAFAEYAVNHSGATSNSGQDAAKNAVESTTLGLSENVEPAYNLTVDVDECYYVRGDAGVAYLVSNSSHASTAFGYSHQAIRSGLLADRSAIPSKPRKLVPRMPDGSIPVARTYVQEQFQQRRQDGAIF